jgi:hypothetical protein
MPCPAMPMPLLDLIILIILGEEYKFRYYNLQFTSTFFVVEAPPLPVIRLHSPVGGSGSSRNDIHFPLHHIRGKGNVKLTL